MFDNGETLTEVPVPTAVPPHEPEYQCHVAPADNVPFTCRAELPPVQIGEALVAEVGLEGIGVTVTDVLTQVELHVPFCARTK